MKFKTHKGESEVSDCPDRQMNLTVHIVVIYSHHTKLLSYQITDLLAVMIRWYLNCAETTLVSALFL